MGHLHKFEELVRREQSLPREIFEEVEDLHRTWYAD
jgi:hypothetical protein